jgi:tetratricopeptide (TPR) repeat protein
MEAQGHVGEPSTVLETAIPANLSENERRVLGYAAAVGREFDFSLMQASLDIDEEKLAEILEDLVHKGVFREIRGGDRYVFTRDEAMAQATRDVSSSRMRVIHRKVAEAMEKLYPNPDGEVIPNMARHFYLGKVHDKSLLYNRYSATLARNSFSPDTAIQYLERVLEDLDEMSGSNSLDRADVYRELGDLFVATGDAAKADEFYGKSLELMPSEEGGTMRAVVLLARAEAARELDRLGRAKMYCAEAITQFERAGQVKGLAMAHRLLGRVAYKEGDFEFGKAEIEKTLALLNPVEDAKDIARCYIDIGNVYSNTDRPEDIALSADYFRKAITALEPLHDYREISRAHNNLAVLISNSDPQEALEELAEAKRYAEMAKDRRSVGWALFNSVEFLLMLGRGEEAERANKEAESILSKLSDPMGMQQVALNEGILGQYHRNYVAAEAGYRKSLQRAEALGYALIIAELHVRLADLYADWERPVEAKKEIALVDSIGRDKVIPSVRPIMDAALEKIRRMSK